MVQNSGRKQLVKSAARTFEILEYFSKRRAALRLKDFVEQLGYPSSSLAALLKSMTTQGFLTFDVKTRSYMPSPRLAGLLSWVPVKRFEQDIVLNAMHSIQRKTHELVVLGIERGIHLEYIETIRSSEGMQLYITPGTTRLLVQSVMGWHLLGCSPDNHVEEVYRATVAMGELEEREFSLKQLLAGVRQHRELPISFARARDFIRPAAHWGGGMISTLVPVPHGHRKLAIGVGGLADRLDQKLDMISECLRAEIRQISRLIKEDEHLSAS